MTKVLDKKLNLEAVAVQNEDGSFTVTYEDGSEKTVAPATLKRWFKKLGEIEIENEEQDNADDADQGENDEAAAPDMEDEVVTGEDSADEGSNNDEEVPAGDKGSADDAEGDLDSVDYDGLIAETLSNGNRVILISRDVMADKKGELTKSESCIKLLIQDREMYLDIADYKGWTTAVILGNERHDTIYKSPKISIKETLNWLQGEMALDDAEVTEINKAIVKVRRESKKSEKTA